MTLTELNSKHQEKDSKDKVGGSESFSQEE
jgi:hypothetical protein